MTSDKTKLATGKYAVPLMIDEDIELDEGAEIAVKPSLDVDASGEPIKMRTNKPTIAGIFLIMAFFFNLLLPITFIQLLYDAEIATGETTLIGTVEDNDENPIENVTITIVDANLTTMTDENGKYNFDSIPVGIQKVKFTKPGYREYIIGKTMLSQGLLNSLNEKDNIIDVPGLLQNGVYINPLDGPFIISESMTDALNSTILGFVVDPTGTPVSDVHLDVVDTNISTTSDNEGGYILDGIKPGIVTIIANMGPNTNFTTRTILFASNTSMKLNITYNKTTDMELDDISGQTGSISGQVKDEDNRSIENARVILHRPQTLDSIITTLTQGDGEFEFNNVPFGFYNLRIEPQEHHVYELKNITLNNEQLTITDISLEQLEEPKTQEDEISGAYTCTIVLVILGIITLIGGISALQRKRYGIAFFGAILGIAPVILVFRLDICVASLLCIAGLVVLVFSREEFKFK